MTGLRYFSENEYMHRDEEYSPALALECSDGAVWLLLDLAHFPEGKLQGVLTDLAAFADKAGVPVHSFPGHCLEAAWVILIGAGAAFRDISLGWRAGMRRWWPPPTTGEPKQPKWQQLLC